MPVSVKRGPYIVDSNGQILGYSSTEILVKPDSVKRVRPSPLTLRDSTYRTVYSQSEVRVLYRPFPGVSTAETILSSGFEYSGNDAPALDGAVMKLRGKIKNEASNLAVFSAEFRQSCSLFRSLAGELYQGFRAIKRGHLVDAYRDLSRDRGFSKKWIEYQFGLVPLVSDLKSTCDGLADSLRNGIRLQARVSNKDIQTYKRVFRNAYGNIETQEEFYKVDVRLKAEYTISDITLRNVSRFGFVNAPAAAWELIPFSFVVDYVYGVGDWLSSLDALNGITDLVFVQGIKTTHDAVTSVNVQQGAARSNATYLARSGPSTSLGLPYPKWDPSDSYKKVLNGLALLRLLGR